MPSSAKGNGEEVDLGETGGGGETGRSGGRKIVVGMDCMREESILNLKRKEAIFASSVYKISSRLKQIQQSPMRQRLTKIQTLKT